MVVPSPDRKRLLALSLLNNLILSIQLSSMVGLVKRYMEDSKHLQANENIFEGRLHVWPRQMPACQQLSITVLPLPAPSIIGAAAQPPWEATIRTPAHSLNMF